MKKLAFSTPLVAFASGDTAPVTAPAAAGNTTKAKRAPAPAITAVSALPSGVTMPEYNPSGKRGSKSIYPFDTLEVGQAFGVKNKSTKDLSSVISNQNRADRNQRNKLDAQGNVIYKSNPVKDAAGNVTNIPTNEPETEQIKTFFAIDVDADWKTKIKGSALEGSSVLVFRSK